MKFRFSIAVAVVLLAVIMCSAVLYAQTKVTPVNIGSGGVTGPKVWVVLPSGAVQLADLQGLTIDTSGAVPVLKAISATQARSFIVKVAAPNPSVSLPEAPLPGTLSLYRNGLLLAETEDYGISGNIINAVGGVWLAGDIIQAKYER